MESHTHRKGPPAKTRTRKGCTNCRRSKVKCDEQKPACTRCRQRNLECSSPSVQLKWESDFHSQGKAFGRSGVWGKGSSSPASKSNGENTWVVTPSVHSWGFLNCDTLSLSRTFNGEQSSLEPILLPAREIKRYTFNEEVENFDYSATPTLQQTVSLFPALEQLRHGIFFDYYINQICPRATSSHRSNSPFASIILPYCLSASPAVLKAIQALGACHWSQHDPNYTSISLGLKYQVIQDFRRRLAADNSFLLSKDPEVLVIMMMLCLYEIVDHCDYRWIVHLQGAKDMIQFRRQQLFKSNRPQDDVSSFIELFFAFQDVMGRTACAKADLFGASYWDENDDTINHWMGCSPSLVSILFSVMDLSRTRRDITSEADEVTLSIKSSMLNRRLGDLVQRLPDPDDQTLQAVGDLKKLACEVYLQSALYSAEPSTSLIKAYVRRIMKSASHLVKQEFTGNIMWPIFVAAVELDPLDDELWTEPETGVVVHGRELVLRSLMTMAKSSVSSVSRTRAVIEQVWQARDFDILKAPEPKGFPLPSMNDWERYVVPVSDALSLV
ncbi:fungal-specific transcription factor domain-containing protein [Aspergillus cavernicola]|uniref:Fungal-specific transcription factor domain-containing protein n=1 Tax=Aspergillus cavernicola TaxID=176166 RepID=A0ABR4IRR4_9EURO